jgi:integrase
MATSKIIIRKNKIKQNNNYPIALRVSKEDKSTYITLRYDCKENQWEKGASRFNKNYPNYRRINKILGEIEDKADRLLKYLELDNECFSVQDFVSLYKENKEIEKKKRTSLLIPYFNEIIEDLRKSNKIGNAKIYNDTKNSFVKFLGSEHKDFTNRKLTLRVLNKYHVYLSPNYSDGGISIRFRTLRAVFNKAIKEGYADSNDYPFNDFNFGQFKGKKSYDVLTPNEINNILTLNLDKHPYLKLSKDTFLFSYYLGGMNFTDLIQLEWKNIHGDTLRYTRSKTQANFKFRLNTFCQEVIEYYRQITNSTKYVFPYLKRDNLTQIQIFNRKDKTLKKYNKELKVIAELAGISKNITSYVSRHSFANNLRESGADRSVISQALGHKNQQITETYLKELDNELINEAISKL